jgi:hypothetical protein
MHARVIISQAAEPDSSVLHEPLLGPSQLHKSDGVETPVPARSEDKKEPAVAKPAPEKAGANASSTAAAVETPVPARSEDKKEPAVAKLAPEKAGANASSTAAAKETAAEDGDEGEGDEEVLILAPKRRKMEIEEPLPEQRSSRKRECTAEEMGESLPEQRPPKKRDCSKEEEKSLHQNDLRRIAEYEEEEARAAKKTALKRSRGSESSSETLARNVHTSESSADSLAFSRPKSEILGSCGVCRASLTKRIGIFFCMECGGDVCAAPSCSWLELGRCKNCTPRLLAKAVAASAEDSTFWSDTPFNKAKGQNDFKRDLQEAIYLKHDLFTGTHMHPHTSTLQHTYVCTPRISYTPHAPPRALHQ